MEERNNKNNTMLLTVIAIATLLVAVIGATFAYFTANISGRESQSTVIVDGAILEINFADDNSAITVSNIVPTKKVNNTYEPIYTKSFTLQGTNTTGYGNQASPEKKLPYELYFVVTTNEFQLKHVHETNGTDLDSQTALTYILENTTTGENTGIPTNEAYGNIGALAVPTKTIKSGEDQSYDVAQVAGDLVQTIKLYDDNGAERTGTFKGFKLGQAYFAKAQTNAPITHSYSLKVYYNETGFNQDSDKNANFAGYVAISVGNQSTEIADNYNKVNCVTTPDAKVASAGTHANTAACTSGYNYTGALS